jgi:hypothetical protein
MSYKFFSPYQKFQFCLFVLIPVLFLICFAREFFVGLFGLTALPDTLQGIFAATWAIILFLSDPKLLMEIIAKQLGLTPTPKKEEENVEKTVTGSN